MSRHVDTKHSVKNSKAVVVRGLEVIDEENDEDDEGVVEELKESKNSVFSSSSSLNLLTDAYKPATIKKYRGAVLSFLTWCQDEGISKIGSWIEMDDVLFSYFQNMYEMKMSDSKSPGGKSKAADTLHGLLMYLPRARNELMTAAKAVRNWNRLSESVSYPPLTKDLGVLIAVEMMRMGQSRQAIATLVGFDCLLRVGELTSLRFNDVADCGDSRFPSEHQKMSIRLCKTKTGSNQFVVVRNPAVAVLVRGLLKITSKQLNAPLFPFTSDQYRRLFKKVCAKIGLSDRYVPHSLRHGGATHLFMAENMTVENIMVVGRWAALKSAKRYIQGGRALLMTVTIPDGIARFARVFAKDVLYSLELAKEL